jgi:hypothetical protein
LAEQHLLACAFGFPHVNYELILTAISEPRENNSMDSGLFRVAAGAGIATGPTIETKAAASRRTP